MPVGCVVDEKIGGWVDMLNDRFKVELSESRQAAFARALSALGTSNGLAESELYDRAVRRQLAADIWAQIIHIATNHETQFYRNPAVIDLVTELAHEFSRPKIVSIGCSTGEEPYSLAIELVKAGMPGFTVHGTDISEICISTANAGRYPSNYNIPDQYAPRSRCGKYMAFSQMIRDKVSFERHNVLGDRPLAISEPHIVLTQHMLIYYRSKARHQILDALSCLVPAGGYLITAATEEAGWSPSGFERMHNMPATVFRKS